MTTKPKAKKFRIRRAVSESSAAAMAAPPQAADDMQSSAATAPVSQAAVSPEATVGRAVVSARSDTAGASDPTRARAEAGPGLQEARQARPAGAGSGTKGTGTQGTGTQGIGASPGRQDAVARQGAVSSPAEVAGETDMDAIRREGLTGRQLRMARRVAQRHGLAPTSDFDAVRMLRSQGIDPFQQSNMLELVVGKATGRDGAAEAPAPRPATDGGDGAEGAGGGDGPPSRAALPATRPKGPDAGLPDTVKPGGNTLPSTETASPADRRAAEIYRIQQDLAKRRRRRLMLLMARLAFFVMLPTAIAGYYFYSVATPMYATKSEFLILKNDGGGGGMGGLLTGTQFATNQDAIAVQSYLTSKDAMLRLDADVGFSDHFTQEWIDPIQRLDPDPSIEDAFGTYKRNIEIGYDPTEGVIKMEVIAADPETTVVFSERLISYAEERVDNLSQRKRTNAVRDAEQGLAEAEAKRVDAQERLVRLQQENAVIDPEARIGSLRGQISTIEQQLTEKQLQLQALLDNARPNSSRVEGAQGDIRRLEAMLERLNVEMTTQVTGDNSLAEIAVKTQLAQADLATRDMMLQSALERLETARQDADSQARYLTTSVIPVAPEDAAYPRKFENTILAFLIFSGLYLMFSLTASILREQVSS